MIDFSLGEYQQVVLALSRLTVGLVMVYFGWPKIKDLRANANDFTGMGFKPGWFWGTPIAFLEFFGGILMIVGVYAEIFAILFAAQMLVGTIWKVKVQKGFPHYSYDLILFALCLVLIVFGAGSYSVLPFSFS
ncbi:hypothetical protein CL654_01325 [bacterium]|nr:hypothetical protein [bacterium]|tara:strand:- start:9705 stop:10103 length:399 start_codon:yes stop_codon:yes gene_type:complete